MLRRCDNRQYLTSERWSKLTNSVPSVSYICKWLVRLKIVWMKSLGLSLSFEIEYRLASLVLKKNFRVSLKLQSLKSINVSYLSGKIVQFQQHVEKWKRHERPWWTQIKTNKWTNKEHRTGSMPWLKNKYNTAHTVDGTAMCSYAISSSLLICVYAGRENRLQLQKLDDVH